MVGLLCSLLAMHTVPVAGPGGQAEGGERAECYLAPGWHGGYYLTDEPGFGAALDALLHLFSGARQFKAALEIEPYTLERMLHGEAFDVERRGRLRPRVVGWTGGGPGKVRLEYLAEAARSGKVGVRLKLVSGPYVNVCQPLSARGLGGLRLRFSAWVRNRRGDAHIYIDAHAGDQVIEGSGRVAGPVPDDGKWHRVELTYIVPTRADTIFPQGRITSPGGEADFDDLSLVRMDSGEELLPNPGFERFAPRTLRDRDRLGQLRALVRGGRAEVVGGAYTQPIMYMIGQESVIQQFVIGCRAVKEALGKEVQVYAAQEPDWVGQMPQILRLMGFRAAVYQTSWQAFGAAPARDAEAVWWRGPDGTRLLAVPMAAAMRAGWGLRGPSPRAAAELWRTGVRRALFMPLADLVAHAVPGPDEPQVHGRVYTGLAHVCKGVRADAAAGRVVVLSAWLRARAPGAHLYIDAYQGRRNLGGCESRCVPADGQWHRATLTWRVPPEAEILYPQARIYARAERGDVDVDGLSLRVEGTGQELLPAGSFESQGLPEGWAVAGIDGAEATFEIVARDAKDGERYLRLRMKPVRMDVAIVTPSEYLDAIGKPEGEWDDAYAGFEHRYPWGILAGEHLRADRLAEQTLLAALRADAIAGWGLDAVRDELWRLVLIGQHHDAWVCGPVHAFGIWAAGYERYVDLTAACWEELRRRLEGRVPAGRRVRGAEGVVINTGGVAVQYPIRVVWTLPRGYVRRPLIVDGEGRPVQGSVEVSQRYEDGSAKELTAAMRLSVPGLGWRKVRVVEGRGRAQARLGSVARMEESGRGVLDNGIVRVRVGREGVEVFRGDRPVLAGPAHLAGHFPDGPKRSRFDKIAVRGEPGMGIVEAEGAVGPVALRLRVSVAAECPLVRLDVDCDFGEGTAVGEGPDQRPLRAVWSCEERKLRWVFPLPREGGPPRFGVHGAFELREPPRRTWPIIDFAVAHGSGGGLAVYTDRATSGVFDADGGNLGVVLAYGGEFIYAPARRAHLVGNHRYSVVLYPFNGSLEDAAVAQMAEGAWPEVFVIAAGGRMVVRGGSALVDVVPGRAACVSTCYVDGKDVVVRLWRPYAGEAQVRVRVAGATEIWKARPDGGALAKLADGEEAGLVMDSQRIVTLRAVGAAGGRG